MPTFPAYAKLLFSDYAEQRESALLRTEMEAGPPKQMRIKTKVLKTRPVAVYLGSKADYAAFEAWFSSDISEGAQWFDITDPVTGSIKQARFSGDGLTATPMPGGLDQWIVKAKIETWG